MQSYQYGLAEDIKERVDAKGHVILTTDQAKLLSRTKVLCVTTVIVITNWMVMNRSSEFSRLLPSERGGVSTEPCGGGSAGCNVLWILWGADLQALRVD